MKDKTFYTNHSIRMGGELVDISKPRIMGILNLTEDSFYAGSRITHPETLLSRAATMLDEGADFLDLGACSTRPGAEPVPEDIEIEKVVEATKLLSEAFPEAAISVDTFRSRVAEAAIGAGAGMINDISGGRLDEHMFDAVAELGVPYVLMHSRGTPQTMNSLAEYGDVVDTVVLELSKSLEQLRIKGVADVLIDPGFGFAKTVEHNFEMLRRLDEFSIFDAPLLVGLSRKSMIWRTLNIDPGQAANGTTALNMLALQNGANFLRVHDVREARETVALFEALRQTASPSLSN